jgi:hypothetical protein
MKKGAWDEIYESYSVKKVNVSNQTMLNGINQFKSQLYETELIYFKSGPEEIIGVTKTSVRYVFNPKLSDRVLDGFDRKLSLNEKIRIRDRVQKVIMNYQCDEGLQRSYDLLEEKEVY